MARSTLDARGARVLAWPLGMVVVVTAGIQPISGIQLASQPSFVPAMLALVGCLDVLSAALLIRQFRDTGDRRDLALGWAYVFTLIVLAGYAAAFPGVLGTRPPLGQHPSTAPWLWVTWHSAFPVLLGAALAPWPAAWREAVPVPRRRAWAWGTTTMWATLALLTVAVIAVFDRHLPVIIHGLDTSAMITVAGPFVLPLAITGTALAIVGARTATNLQRWGAVAATAALGDVVLTLFSGSRYSLGWYAGRTLTVVSSAVVLVALLWEFGGIKRQLAEEGERLKLVLAHTADLEQLQAGLLDTMADGVLMRLPDGRVVAANPAAERLLGLTAAQLRGIEPVDRRWQITREDGNQYPFEEMGNSLSLDTIQENKVVGVLTPDGRLRWLAATTMATDPARSVTHFVSSLSDVTVAHSLRLAAAAGIQERRERIESVLTDEAMRTVFQPIVDLATGHVVGAEALTRFPGDQPRPPDVWFAEAAETGLGTALELAAIRAALRHLPDLPSGVYLSLNASPATVASPALAPMLARVPPGCVVLELTEHADVKNYAALHDALTVLRSRGVRLAVDDAGAGFASLRHILNLRPDIIKLDIGIVHGIHTDPARRALAGAMLTFARDINAVLIAEGIELEAELTTLQDIGIDHGQGYYLGRPAPLPLQVEASGYPSEPARALRTQAPF
jgi:PAS domain S-box-containing protein